jgi:hypothetical protein
MTGDKEYEVPDIKAAATPCILSHLWQEFHKNAKTTKYTGPTNDDRKVAENNDAKGNPQPKQRIHLCFQEKALATIKANAGSSTYYACWQILDAKGNVVKEHPQFTKANYDKKAASARLKTGRHSQLWDGRNSTPNPVFVAPGTYQSHIIVKDNADKQIEQSDASIEVEGNPYRIFIVGRPKSDAELRSEFARPALNSRFLNTNGERIARDCWITVYRGEQNEGHIVFLGQGTEEATTARSAPNFGAIATPHNRDYKGWIRSDPHKVEANPDRIQIEDLGHTDYNLQLTNPSGPAPTNPDNNNQPSKAGVQAHVGSASEWTFDNLSVGCTTVKTITGATITYPGSVLGNVRSINSSFGVWGTGGAGQNVATAGPDFVNKQTKRKRIDDALIVDDHGAPELNPPQHPPSTVGAALPDEPLHIQPSMQQGVFGGFKGHEIPQDAAVDDEPTDELRIRMCLEDYANGSMYYQYHHAVAFGHAWETSPNGYRITIWIPRKVIRGWNGNRRNVLVMGNCQIAWYVERRLTGGQVGPPQLFYGLYPTGASAGSYAALQSTDIGMMQRTWATKGRLAAGEYVSIFRYKVELKPYVTGNDVWTAENRKETDLFSAMKVLVGQPASMAAERIVTEGDRQYIEGYSELSIITV